MNKLNNIKEGERMKRKWEWEFWKKNPKNLSTRIKKYLQKQFDLDKEEIKNLMMITKRGLWCGKKATFIRIFNPIRLNGLNDKLNYSVFDSHPEWIIFEGYEQEGFVFISPKKS